MIRFFARSRRNIFRESSIWLLAVVISLPSFALVIKTGVVKAAASGDGRIIYGEGTVTSPRTRTWTQATTSWEDPESSTVAADATIRHINIKASPTRDEMIAGIQATTGVLYIQRWNGSTWSAEWNVTVGDGNLARFDLSYERSSGDLMIVYSRNVATTNELGYRIWNGSSWTSETTYDAVRTSQVVGGITLISRGSGSDHMAMAWADTNMDLSANYWDGSTWQSEPAAVLAADLSEVGTGNILTNWSFDLEFESTSGELLVVWGLDATADPRYVTRGAGAAGAWGSITTATALFEEPTDLDLSGDPGSDYIAYINSTDNGGDSDAAMWTGSAWANANNFDTTNDTLAAGTSNNAIGWLTSGTQVRAVGTYDDANGAGLDWLVFDKNAGTWTLQTDCTTACNSQPASGDDKIHRIRMNPFDESQLTWVGVDTNSDLFAKRLSFDGTNLTWSSHEPSSAALEATVSSITGISIDFAYNRTLSPIVDQLHYRWRSDDGNETTGTSLQNEDTAHTGLAKSTNIRLRFTINNTGGSATNYNYRLEWAAASGACDGTGETFAAVPDTATTEPFDMTTTTNYADQAASTNAASGPGVLTDPGGSTFAAGYLLESPSNQTPNLTLAQNIFTELEYNFQANTNATDSTTYCFRLSNAGTGLNTYTRYAEVTTAAPPGPTTDQVLRHGNWWSGGAEQSFFWAQ